MPAEDYQPERSLEEAEDRQEKTLVKAAEEVQEQEVQEEEVQEARKWRNVQGGSTMSAEAVLAELRAHKSPRDRRSKLTPSRL